MYQNETNSKQINLFEIKRKIKIPLASGSLNVPELKEGGIIVTIMDEVWIPHPSKEGNYSKAKCSYLFISENYDLFKKINQ